MRFYQLTLVMLLAACAVAQEPWHPGAQELAVFSGGGPAITGGKQDRAFWLAGARWGLQLTDEHCLGWVHGHLQYAAEFIPLYFQFQSTNVYGIGLTPFLMRYHFTHSRRVVPMVEVGAGMLFTREQVPENTSRFNFTPQGGIGIEVLRDRLAYVFGVRYHHTSNAGLAQHNPGINAIMLQAGVSWWK